MRVLITSPVFPPDLGGPGVYVPNIGRFLVERGHTVKVVAFCSDPEPKGHPFEVVTIPMIFWPIRYLRTFLIVLREARRHDVVYVQEHLALFHVLAAKLTGTPAVIRIMIDGAWEIAHRRGWMGNDNHDEFQTKKYGLRVELFRWLQRKWWGWTRHIICCSEYLRQILIRHYDVPAEKVQRIYNAYNGPAREDFPQTPAEARAELGLEEGSRYLLSVCRLVDWKGVDFIIRALKGMPEDVVLLVAGEGEKLVEWQGLAQELGLSERVRFLGNVPHARVPLYVRAAELFVLNSEYEGLSHTLLEVSAIGTPIVSSNVCGNPEVVEDGVNGLTVPPRDPDALRAALERLLGDADLQQRFVNEGLAGGIRFLRTQTYPQVEAVLLEVAGQKRELAGAG